MVEVYKNGPVEVAFTVYEVKESSCSMFFCYEWDATNEHILSYDQFCMLAISTLTVVSK